MHTGFVGGEPDERADDDVDRGPADPHALHHHDEGQAAGRGEQPEEGDLAGVEDGDHEDAADVVDDGEGQQEDLQRRRDPRAEEGDDAEREGDVGGHRDAPPGGGIAPGVEGQVDRGRHDHAADGSERRHGGGPQVAELAGDQLPLDLESDDEEEDRHQRVVDQLVQRQLEVEGTDPDVDDLLPQVGVGVG